MHCVQRQKRWMANIFPLSFKFKNSSAKFKIKFTIFRPHFINYLSRNFRLIYGIILSFGRNKNEFLNQRKIDPISFYNESIF